MAKPQYDFSGLPIDELIAKPLLGAVIAQTKMAELQSQSMLKNCFDYNRKTKHYEPKMLKMVLVRGVLTPGLKPGSETIKEVITYFYLPFITIFPFSPLGVESVNIEFDMEIVSQYSLDTEKNSEEGNVNNILSKKSSNVEMLGKIMPRNVSDTGSGTSASESGSQSFGYSVDVTAGPLPLTQGLLSIIELYTKSITPIEMPKEYEEE